MALLAIALLATIPTVQAQQRPVSELWSSLFANPNQTYDAQLRPLLGSGRPVEISTALRINLLFNVDSKEETFQMDMFVHEYWQDPRLQYNESIWPLSNSLRVPSRYTPWLPDTFFFNAVKCLTVADSSLTLSPDGTVLWSRHQSCTFHSPFDLLNFPFDEQTIAVRRTSFSYTDDELVLKFVTPTGWRPDPQTDFMNSLWDFEYAFSNTTSLVFIDTHSANAYIRISRKSMNYVLKMILPMCLLVLLSSLSYAVDPSSPPARVGFSVALVLSIVTFNLVVSQDLPKINYATLLDWYVWCCFVFVVLALGEYAAVNNLIVSKRFGPALPYLVDDFAMWTMPQSWIIFNLCYWPLYNSVGLTLVLVVLWSAWMLLNVFRIRWNHVNGKRGLWEPTKHAYRFLRHEWNRAPVLSDLHSFENISDDEDDAEAAAEEEKKQQQAVGAAQAQHAIAVAEATGANVFEVNAPAAHAHAAASGSVVRVDRPPSPSGVQSPSAAPLLSFGSAAAFSPSPDTGDEPNPFDDAAEGGYSQEPSSSDQRYVLSPQDEEFAAEPEQEQEQKQAPEEEDINLV